MTSQQGARFMSTFTTAALLAAITAGCGDGQDPGATGGTGGDGGSIGDVTGTLTTTFVTEQGEIVVPEDLSGQLVSAIHQNAEGEWWSSTGVGKADGSFTIPGVPEGPFYLDVGVHRYYTKAREVALSSYQAGRADRVFSEKETHIAAQMTGLTPWVTGDRLEWFAGNVGSSFSQFSPPGIALGDTALSGLTVDWRNEHLLDASKGDTLYVTQLSRQPGAGDTSYATISRFARFDDVTLVDGATTTVTGTFSPAMNQQSLAVDFRASELLSAAADVNPGAKVRVTPRFSVATQPAAAKHGDIARGAILVEVYPNDNSDDPNLGTIAFDNPYPASWGAYGKAYVEMSVEYPVPGAAKPLTQTGFVWMTADLATIGGGPIRPAVTPALDPRLNGKSAFDPLVGITTTPTLSWSPPAVGSPSVYSVSVYYVDALKDGSKVFFFRGYFNTSETSIPIPPNFLQAGKPHVFGIIAVVDPAVDPSHPSDRSVNHASATTWTNLVVP